MLQLWSILKELEKIGMFSSTEKKVIEDTKDQYIQAYKKLSDVDPFWHFLLLYKSISRPNSRDTILKSSLGS